MACDCSAWMDGKVWKEARCSAGPICKDLPHMSTWYFAYRTGTVVVTLTKAFADQATWAVVQRMQRRMSWGHATVFVMVKVQ